MFQRGTAFCNAFFKLVKYFFLKFSSKWRSSMVMHACQSSKCMSGEGRFKTAWFLWQIVHDRNLVMVSFLLHDTAGPHTARPLKTSTSACTTSPVLTRLVSNPCDFYLFEQVIESLGGKIFFGQWRRVSGVTWVATHANKRIYFCKNPSTLSTLHDLHSAHWWLRRKFIHLFITFPEYFHTEKKFRFSFEAPSQLVELWEIYN